MNRVEIFTDILNKLAIILVIVVGTYFLIYHRKLGRETAESLRNKILPLKKPTPKEYSIIYLVGGIILCLVGGFSPVWRYSH
jgi:uncharacterized membrane protein